MSISSTPSEASNKKIMMGPDDNNLGLGIYYNTYYLPQKENQYKFILTIIYIRS